MCAHPKHYRGYSLIELLIVFVIVGILATIGVMMINNPSTGAVKTVADQVEATLMQAQKNAVATGQDIYVVTTGTWTDANNPLTMDPRPFDTTVPIVAPATSYDPYSPTARIGGSRATSSDVFRSLFSSNIRDHMHACVDTGGSNIADSLITMVPFTTDANFLNAYQNRLCRGANYDVVVNAVTKRFIDPNNLINGVPTGFSIVIASTSSGGTIRANGAVVVLVVPTNSANIYRFYRAENATTWERQ